MTTSEHGVQTIGILGGVSCESTADYYLRIHRAFDQTTYERTGYPEIVIVSLNCAKALRLLEHGRQTGDWEECIQVFLSKVKLLARMGADCVAIPCNTFHVIFDRLQAESPIPMLSIVTSVRRFMKKEGLEKALLLGSDVTMTNGFYEREFERFDAEEAENQQQQSSSTEETIPPPSTAELFVPDEADQSFLNSASAELLFSPDLLDRSFLQSPAAELLFVPNTPDRSFLNQSVFGELIAGQFREETRQKFVRVIEKAVQEYGIDSVVLGCTEIPLLLPNTHYAGVRMIDTTQIHVDAIVQFAQGNLKLESSDGEEEEEE